MSSPYRIAFKEFSGVPSSAKHPVVANKNFEIKATLIDSKVEKVPINADTFDLLNPAVSVVEFRFWSNLNLTGTDYTTIKIIQRFMVYWVKDGAGWHYRLVPHQWINEDLAGVKPPRSHLGTHPLLEHDANTRLLTLNCLVVDLTAFWRETHRNNRNYRLHDLHWPNGEVTLKVFAHLGGAPFIWYVLVPKHLARSNGFSPHVFFQPADNTEFQRIYETGAASYAKFDLEYLKAGASGNFTSDGKTLMEYLLPPVDDVEIDALLEPYNKLDLPVRKFRNVVSTIEKSGEEIGKDKISPLTWENTRAGMGRPFATGKRPEIKQFLLVPQRPKDGLNGLAISRHLPNIVNAIGHLLWSNDRLVNQESDDALVLGEYIISCFSESGVDLWNCATNNIDRIKAVIAIEPQNMNTVTNAYEDKSGAQVLPGFTGAQVIPRLVKRGIAVFIIGRHHATSYHPEVSQSIHDRINYLPTNPAKVFAYPPDPTSNDFVRYRVSRLLDINSDSAMSPLEKDRLTAALKQVGSAAKLYRLIFHDAHNVDKGGGTFDRWYSHHFALIGGSIMALPKDYATTGMYGKPVSYLTWFQQSVEAIG